MIESAQLTEQRRLKAFRTINSNSLMREWLEFFGKRIYAIMRCSILSLTERFEPNRLDDERSCWRAVFCWCGLHMSIKISTLLYGSQSCGITPLTRTKPS